MAELDNRNRIAGRTHGLHLGHDRRVVKLLIEKEFKQKLLEERAVYQRMLNAKPQ